MYVNSSNQCNITMQYNASYYNIEQWLIPYIMCYLKHNFDNVACVQVNLHGAAMKSCTIRLWTIRVGLTGVSMLHQLHNLEYKAKITQKHFLV